MNQITYEEREEVYKAAVETFGVPTQLVVALEEMSECQKEVCKALRIQANMNHLIEEVADATIMLEQIRLIFDINEPVCEAMDQKIERLRQRIVKVLQGKAPKRYPWEEKTESGLLEEE